MKNYYTALNRLVNAYNNYTIKLMTANNGYAPPAQNGPNMRLIRKNNKANLILHRQGNGVVIAWGHTKPNAQHQKLGTKIRALAALAAINAKVPLYQESISPYSRRIMNKLGATKNNNYSNNRYRKLSPNTANRNKIASFLNNSKPL
jgi:hypothetical protein